MEVLPEKKEALINDIKGMRNGSTEQMVLVSYYSLVAYFKSLLSFGRKSTVTRDNLNIIKEMYRILKQEDKLLLFILKNIDNVDIDAAAKVVGMLDELNDKTLDYYYKVIEDIEDACDVKYERRGKRPNKSFDTLIQSKSYASQVIALVEDMDGIKKFLGYEEDFWNYITPLVKKVSADVNVVGGMFYAIPVYNTDSTVHAVNLLVPEVVDLDSALLCIKLYEKAYKIYKSIGKQYQPTGEDFTLQLKYEDEYLPSKTDIVLK